MSGTKILTHSDADGIGALLTGRRIIAAEQGRFERPDHTWGEAPTGRLTLDDGTVVLVSPSQGGCSCGAGDYELTSLATCDNIITSVRVAEEVNGDESLEPDRSYRVYVVADAVQINAVQSNGNDGNGYYGTGYDLIVTVPQDGEKTEATGARS